jgi:hypothetical protein
LTATVGLILWIGLPATGLFWLSHIDHNTILTPERTASVQVKPNDAEAISTVDLGLVWTAPADLVAPAWSGVVQTVLAKPGDRLANGSGILVVDGILRTAWSTPGALYRPLQVGDRGEDVKWLKAILVSTSIPQTSDDRFDASTLRGVRSFATRIGVREAKTLESFDPAWIIFMQESAVTVAAVELQAGAPAPAPGTSVVSATPTLTQVKVAPAGVLDSLRDTDDPATAAARLVEFSGVAAPDSAVLYYGTTEISLNPDRASADQPSVTALAAVTEPETLVVTAQARRPAADGEFVVPAAAIASNSDGTTCVVIGGIARSVHVLTSDSGATVISGTMTAADAVTVPPPVSISCPSS